LENSGSLVSSVNPSGKFVPLNQLLVKFAEKHVRASKEAKENKKESEKFELKVQEEKQRFRNSLGKVGQL
jgi:hypothetical protein